MPSDHVPDITEYSVDQLTWGIGLPLEIFSRGLPHFITKGHFL
jgi:hypothetical protein